MAESSSRQDSDTTGVPGATTGRNTATTPSPTESSAGNLAELARSAMADPGATAQELARRAGEQAAMASDALYQQGTRAGEYLTRNVNEYPFAALLIAGAIGYGLGFLIHTRWHSDEWAGNRSDIEQGESLIDGRPPY